jgi:hypothetical protein
VIGMARFGFLLGFLLPWTSFGTAQDLSVDPPTANRPADFSNIIGKYDIKVSAEPTDVEVEQSITLRISITGAGPKAYEPNHKYLRLFPESWQNDFYVQEQPDRHEVIREKKMWIFIYRLKPKHVKITAIDDIKLVYFNPRISDKDKFVTKYADGIKISVRPKPDQSDKLELPVRAAPDSFFVIVASKDVLAGSAGPMHVGGWQLALLVILPPLLSFIGILAWKRYFPDESRRGIRFCANSARRALSQLQAGDVSAWLVVRQYLNERFNFGIEDPAPREVASFLKRRGFAITLCEQAEAFLQTCDAERFTNEVASGATQQSGAAACLIQSLEDDPCARG